MDLLDKKGRWQASNPNHLKDKEGMKDSLHATTESVTFNLLGSMFIGTLGVHGDDFKAIKASPHSSSLRSLKLGSALKNQ